MKKVLNSKNKLKLIVVCILFLAVSLAACAMCISMPRQDVVSENYLTKISVYDEGQTVITDINDFKSAYNNLNCKDDAEEMSDESLEAIIGFDFDYKNTAEYKSFLKERDELATQTDVDFFRQRLAEKGYTYHKNMMTTYLGNINFSSKFKMMDYSPYVKIYSEDSEVLYNDIISFAQNKNVKKVSVQSIQKNSNPIPLSVDVTAPIYLERSERLEQTGGTNIIEKQIYTGRNVKVGISEKRYPRQKFFSNNNEFKETTEIAYYDTFYTDKRFRDGVTHAERVNLILRDGAPNVKIYQSDLNIESPSDFSWFIEKGVSVINCSWGMVDGWFGADITKYDNTDENIDYQIQTYFLNVVISAGNKKDICSPGYARNAITVTGTETVKWRPTGSADLEKQIRHARDASYYSPANVAKPNLAAPYYVKIKAPNEAGDSLASHDESGTSFAAPQVTAALALLFEKYPALSTRPEEVLARLEASASHDIFKYFDGENRDQEYNNYKSNPQTWNDYRNRDEKLGAGCLNIEQLLEYTISSRFFVDNNNKQDQIIAETSLDLYVGSVFKASLNWLGKFENTGETSQKYVTNYDLVLYDYYKNEKVASSESVNNYSELLMHEVLSGGKYKLCIFQKGAKNVHTNDLLGLAVSYKSVANNFFYTAIGDKSTITGLQIKWAGDLVIPDKIDGRTVTAIDSLFDQPSLTNIIIPENVTTLGVGAFWGNSNLKSIVIPKSMVNIGSSAFADCNNLTTVYYGGLYSASWNSINLESYRNDNLINANRYYYLETIPPNYITGNYWSYVAGKPEIWGNVKFDKQGGSGGNNSVTAVIGSVMPSATAPVKTDCIFEGYYSQSGGKGIKYYNSDMTSAKIFDLSERIILYAKWTTTVTLDKQDGVNGTSSATAIYASAMPSATAPNKTGFAFEGYFSAPNGAGTKYYNANMTSAQDYDFAGKTTLYAKWHPANRSVMFYLNGGTGYFPDMPTYDGGIIEKPSGKPEKNGYVFEFWALSTDLTKEYNWAAPITGNITLVAIWGCLAKFDLNGGTGSFPTVTAPIDSTIAKPSNEPKLFGYVFEFWALSTDLTQEYNWSSPIKGDITLVAVWTKGCVVTFNLNGGTGSFPALDVENGYTVSKPTKEPKKKDYAFKFWALSTDLTKEYNWSSPITDDITLVAVWTTECVVTFNLNGGTGNFPTVTAYYNSTISKPAGKPKKENYEFKFWALAADMTKEYNWSTLVKSDVVLIAVWAAPTPGLSFTLIDNGTAYEVSKGTADTTGEVVIPSSYNGLPVTRIADRAFMGCSYDLQYVLIPDSVTGIGDSAFSNCYRLVSVTIPAGVTYIDDYAFFWCESLKSFTFEENSELTSIGKKAFMGCHNLTSFDFPSGVTYIGEFAFLGCDGLWWVRYWYPQV